MSPAINISISTITIVLDANVALEKIQNFSSLSEVSENSPQSSQTTGDEAIEDLIGRKVGQSVLLQPHSSLHLDDILEILHIEIHSKVIGN